MLAEYLADENSVVGVVGLPGNGPAILARVAESVSRLPAEPADDMEDAVRRARRMLPAGGVVLLSPGAPSGDDFGNFEVRGEAFRTVVAGN